MSDISIDFTWLIFLATVALTAVLLFLIAVVAGLVALIQKDGRRAKRIALNALVMTAAPCLLLGATFGPADHGPRPDWIDYAAIPWFGLFLLACWRLTRV